AVVVLLVRPSLYIDRAREVVGILTGQGGALQSEDPAIRGRAGTMTAAWHIFVDHPLLGVGAGNFVTNFQQYNVRFGLPPRNEDANLRHLYVQTMTDRFPRTDSTHITTNSMYLEIAAEGGILGLMAYGALAVMLGAAIRRSRALLRDIGRPDYAGIAGALGISWIGFAITATFLDERGGHYLFLLAGITLSLPQVAAYEARRSLGFIRRRDSRPSGQSIEAARIL